MELKGKVVLLKKAYFVEGTDLRFKCEDGFGCNSFTSGRSIYGTWISDGTKGSINGDTDIESLVE
jgi:hypothetical protein